MEAPEGRELILPQLFGLMAQPCLYLHVVSLGILKEEEGKPTSGFSDYQPFSRLAEVPATWRAFIQHLAYMRVSSGMYAKH